jgi:hypothetical protein
VLLMGAQLWEKTGPWLRLLRTAADLQPYVQSHHQVAGWARAPLDSRDTSVSETHPCSAVLCSGRMSGGPAVTKQPE